MDLVTYLEDYINALLEVNLSEHKIKKIKNQSLLLFSNDQYKVNELDLDNSMNTLGNIDINGDKFIFDLIKEIDTIYKKKDFYYNTCNFKIQGKANLIETVNINDCEYKEVLKIFINKLSRKYHSKDIILLNFLFDEDFKSVNTDLIKLSSDECNKIKKINSHLNKLVSIFKELYPGISILTFEKSLLIKDIENRKFEFRIISIKKL